MHGPNGQTIQGNNLTDLEDQLDQLENLQRDQDRERRRQARQGPLQVWRLAKHLLLSHPE